MPEIFSQIWERFLEFWGGLSQRNQVILVLILAVTVSIVSILIYWSVQPQWVTLYNRELDLREASQIAAELDDMGVPYRLERSIVKVPLGRVDELRLQLAEADILPQTSVGFEIFEEGGIGITNFERQMRYKRALEGSLERAIISNPDIRNATVNIALPRDEILFKEDKEPVTASVKLQVAPFTELEQRSIDGIVNLVAYGVVGLEKDNVVIMDQHNRTLTDIDSTDMAAIKQVQQLEVIRQIENKLEQQIHNSLGRVLTRDRLAVAVNVEMDFDRVEEQITEYRQPVDEFGQYVDQLRQREQLESRELRGWDVQPGGEAGVESNVPGYEMEDEQMTEYQEEKTMVDYYADKSIRNIVRDPAIKRLSAVVSVDGRHRTELDEETGQIVELYEEPTEQEIDNIRNMAQAAVGFDEDRGDRVEVSYFRFDREAEVRQRLEEQRQREFRRQVIYFTLIALGITFFISGLLLLWQRHRRLKAEEELAAAEEEFGLPAREMMARVSVEDQEQERIVKRVRDTIEDSPETAALVLRSWFVEEI